VQTARTPDEEGEALALWYELGRVYSGAAGSGQRAIKLGFTPEDGFETGPLNVAPDTEGMGRLRGIWERRLAARRQRGTERPGLGLGEDVAYRVFPREMTVPVELATREAYLAISRELLVERYGRDPRKKAPLMPEALRQRVERDLGEYAAITRRPARRSRP